MIRELPVKVKITGPMKMKVLGLEKYQELSTNYTEGGWSGLSLRSFGGSNFTTAKPSCMGTKWMKQHPGAEKWKCVDTDLRKFCPEFDPLIEAVPGDKERIRFLRLAAHKKILPHTDRVDPLFKDQQLCRIHIPIVTNEDVYFNIHTKKGASSAHLEVGHVYYLDAGDRHSVDNDGESDRIHLVLDVFQNTELDRLIIGGSQVA